MKENAKRIVFFEEWMDTPAAMEIFENAEDIQVQKLQYNSEAKEMASLCLERMGIRFSQEQSFKSLGFLTVI